MIRVLSFALLTSFTCLIIGCGDDKTKPASGGGGSTTQATVKAPPAGQRPTME